MRLASQSRCQTRIAELLSVYGQQSAARSRQGHHAASHLVSKGQRRSDLMFTFSLVLTSGELVDVRT